MWAYVVGPMARPGGLGSGLGLNYEIVLWAGPGHTCCGPGLIIYFAGRTRAGSAQLMRARAGPQIFFPNHVLATFPVR